MLQVRVLCDEVTWPLHLLWHHHMHPLSADWLMPRKAITDSQTGNWETVCD